MYEVLGLFADAPIRWWISGGYALESHVGRSWRLHRDIDVGVVRSDAPLVARVLAGWDLRVAASGALSRWEGRELVDGENNIWARRHPDSPWQIDLTICDGTATHWVYRRDPTFQLPWIDAVLTTAHGVPYLAPELQLLFKSKDPRPKDNADVQVVIPLLGPRALALLDVRLRGHPWRSLVARYRRPVDARDVVEMVNLVESAGIAVWVDGGWCVDALVGEQTRDHADLDLAVPSRQHLLTREVLSARRFVCVLDEPHVAVFVDPAGVIIDLHAFDDTATVTGDDGIERYGPDGLPYEVAGMHGHGQIAGRTVRCITADTMARYMSGYEPDADDWHDVLLLHQRCGVPIPAGYERWTEPR